MATIYQACHPRADLIIGGFNPEVFTASLSAVFEHYQNGASAASAVYTDPKTFFTEATYPTNGMRQVLGDVFRRLSGDLTAPAVHRLETGFGGGKTHTLIGLTHIAKRGKALAGITSSLLDDKYLPDEGAVVVVGIVGDELPVQAVKGSKVQPYTLWGELALQVGGETLYKSLTDEAASFSAPGRDFMKAVFGGKKVLVMLDEMAQYWCVYRLQDNNDRPDKFFSREQGGVPMDVNLAEAGWGIVTEPGAKKRDWMAGSVSPTKVKDWARETVIQKGVAKVADVLTAVSAQHGNVSETVALTALHALASEDVIAYYIGEPEQTHQPELKIGGSTLLEYVTPEHSVITRAKAAERGWLTSNSKPSFHVEPEQSRAKLLPLLKRIGNVYTSEGGKSNVDYLDVYELVLPDKGTLRLQLNDASAADMKALQELFEVLMSVAKVGPQTAAELEIKDPIADCGLIKKLKGA